MAFKKDIKHYEKLLKQYDAERERIITGAQESLERAEDGKRAAAADMETAGARGDRAAYRKAKDAFNAADEEIEICKRQLDSLPDVSGLCSLDDFNAARDICNAEINAMISDGFTELQAIYADYASKRDAVIDRIGGDTLALDNIWSGLSEHCNEAPIVSSGAGGKAAEAKLLRSMQAVILADAQRVRPCSYTHVPKRGKHREAVKKAV